MFQSKYIKQIKNDFEQKANFTKGKFLFKNGYYKDVNNGRISIWFYKNSIEVTFQFIDLLPFEHHQNIWELSVKEQSTIHPKINCAVLEFEFISFLFKKDCLKELTFNDLIIASNNLVEFCNKNVVQMVEKNS